MPKILIYYCRQHTMSKLSRAIKFIMAVWVVAFCLAIPQAIQFGLVPMYGGRLCTVILKFTLNYYCTNITFI